jgi:hypothetical protein
VTKDLYYLGDRVAKGDPERRSYCVGLIFEVYLTSCERYAAAHGGSGARFFLPGVDRQDFSGFRKEFYGVNGNEKTFVEALVRRGLGKEIQPVRSAQQAEFVQFLRNGGSGHALCFSGWGRIQRGIQPVSTFWSIQKKTGISLQASARKRCLAIDLDQIYIVRRSLHKSWPPAGLPGMNRQGMQDISVPDYVSTPTSTGLWGAL